MEYEIGRLIKKGKYYIIEKGQTDNGLCYKNSMNYKTGKGVCYVPELDDTLYTKENILDICENNQRLADFVFDSIDWQSPETFLDELQTLSYEFPEFFDNDGNILNNK